MCFIRKGLDWVFTRHELKWLDDIMPESHKREKETKKKKLNEEETAEKAGQSGEVMVKKNLFECFSKINAGFFSMEHYACQMAL